MLQSLSSDVPDNNGDQMYLNRRLKDFTEASHIFTSETELNCREGLRPFYNELGNSSQSALSFLQISTTDRLFIAKLAVGKMFPIRDNQDSLLKLQMFLRYFTPFTST